MMWRWEKTVLDSIAQARLGQSARHLDFACGTGRVLAHFAGKVQASTGVDVSASMLEVARREIPAAEIIQADITRADALGGRQFELITAFRFFPNAEAELRREVMEVLASLLAPGGILIFNNHLKRNSAAHYAERLIGRDRKRRMTPDEVAQMVGAAGLKIVEIRTHGVLPMTERFVPLPLGVLAAVEAFSSKLRPLRTFAQNWIYACERKT